MSTNIGVTLTADDQQLLAVLRSVDGKLDALAASANGSFNSTGAAASRAATQVKALEAQTGMTAKGMNAALRTVPAQFTDIIVSLQGGQPALQVLLQQGGQLKDTFGGIVPAFKALGGYVVGLINPFTIAAAALGAMALAANSAQREWAAANRTLIETGDIAGVTASQLSALAASLDSSTGSTQGRAAEALNLMVRSGVRGAQALRDFTQAALDLENAGGPAVEETAKKFAELAKNPVEASRKLSEETGFLTAELYAQIRALAGQGKAIEAAALAQQAFAEETARLAPQLEANLTNLEWGWLKVKKAVRETGDAIVGVFRTDGTVQEIEKLTRKLELTAGSIYGRENRAKEQASLRALESGAGYEAMSAYYAQQASEARKAGVKWLDEGSKFLSRQEQAEKEIARIRNEGAAAGALTNERVAAEMERRIAIAQQQADPGTNLQAVRDNEAQRLEILRRSQIEIDTRRALGQINERGQIEATTAVTLQGITIRRQAVAAELAIVSKKQDSEREVAALSGQLALLDAERTTAQIKGRSDLTVAIYKQKMAIDAVVRAGQEETRQEQAEYFVQESKAREAASLAAYQYTKSVAESGALLDMEASLMGASRIEREKRLAQYRIEIDLKQRLSDIDKTFGTDPAGEIERQRVREAAARQIAQIERRAYLDEWQQTWDALADGLTDALMRGFANGSEGVADLKKTIERTLRTVYIKPMVDNAVKSILGSVQGWMAQAFDVARGGNMAGTGGNSMGSLLQLFGGGNGGAMGSLGQLLGKAGSAASAAWFGSTASSGVANAALIESSVGTAGYGASAGALGGGAAAGTVSTGGMAAAVSAAMPYVAAIVAGSTAAARDFRNGFNADSAKNIDGILGPLAKTTTDLNSVLTRLGISNEAASILSGATLVSKLFGRGRPNVEGRNIVGTVGAEGFDGAYNERVREKGGLFSSDRVYTVAGEVSDQVVALIDDMAGQVRNTAKGYADALGLPVDSIKNFTKALDIDVTFGTAEEKAKKIEEALRGYADGLFATFDGAVEKFRRLGETSEQVLSRLATLQNFSTDLNALGGVFSRVAGLSVSAREGFIAMAGGMDALRSQAKSFVENYYSRDEVAGVKAREIKDALAAVGITGDITTKDQFRALVEGVDVTTTQGQQQLATLLQSQGSFADVAAYIEEVGGSLASLSALAPQMGVIGGLFTPAEQAQVAATNAVQTAVEQVRDAIVELGNSMTTGTPSYGSAEYWETTVDDDSRKSTGGD
jgi:phage-related minor tail protein